MSKSIEFEKFEEAVIQKILEKNSTNNLILREQYRHAIVVNREFTGVGFFTYFKVPKKIKHVTDSTETVYGNVYCDLNRIKEFGGFVLYLENGVIECLEGYTFYDTWPSVITTYKLYHS